MKSTLSKTKIISTTFFKNFRNGMSGNADVKKKYDENIFFGYALIFLLIRSKIFRSE